MAPLLASLDIFHEVGMSQLRNQSKKLTGYLESILLSELKDKITIITPKAEQSRGCQLSIRLNEPINNILDIFHDRGVLCDWRNPDIIRVAPVPLYNSFEDCYKFVQIVKEMLNEK